MSTLYTQTIIYEAYHTDGGGQGYHTGTIGFFTKQSVAEAAREADKNPYTGLRERNAINIGDTWFLLADPTPISLDPDLKTVRLNQVRERALSKLSIEERQALGIK